jgi:2,3-bisphosphoglycerate-dependent phosphoglycerate mutase
MAKNIAALIRHGDYHQLANVPSAHQPFALNSAGIQQAKALATQLRQAFETFQAQPHPVIDSSQMLRAWQSADVISQALSEYPLTIESFDVLAERCVGSVANLTLTQIEALLEDDPRYESPPLNWKADSYYQLPFQGAESLMQSGIRVANHIKLRMRLLKGTENQIKLFVGHGAAFRHAAFQLGILPFEQIARLSMYHASPIYIELLNNGQWHHIGGEWKVRGREDAYHD